MRRRRIPLIVLATLALGLSGCGSDDGDDGVAEDAGPTTTRPVVAAISVTSPAFDEGGAIPERFSCEGDNVSPALEWAGVPDAAVQLALVVDDPDAPGGTFVHWVLTGLDPSLVRLEEGEVPDGATQGENGAGRREYAGPCPPPDDDAHRYRFTVYALAEDVTAADDLLAATRAAAIAEGTLTGTFDR